MFRNMPGSFGTSIRTTLASCTFNWCSRNTSTVRKWWLVTSWDHRIGAFHTGDYCLNINPIFSHAEIRDFAAGLWLGVHLEPLNERT